MAIDPAAVGTVLAPVTVDVERGRLRLFATAIGESDPVYTDLDVARSAGHRDLPVPPTFLFSLEFEQPDPFRYLTRLGVDLQNVLHGEQSFTYHRVAHAGDRLVVQPRIADVFAKKGGALEFVVKETTVSAADGRPVADLRAVFVVRHPQVRR